jgi:hypothetical protein
MKQFSGPAAHALVGGFLIASALSAQPALVGIPRVDAIEFYGLHRVTPDLARQALGLRVGAPLPPSKGDTEERLMDIDRVIGARLEAVCCDGGKNILYVGIEERDAPRYEVRPAPGGAVTLPEELMAAYRSFEQARHNAELAGKAGEDLTKGHALMTDASARAAQLRFPALAAEHLEVLREVLRESGDEYQRGVAAYVLPYVPAKADVVDDLHAALTDNDAGVRTIVVRDLTSLALLERADPGSKVRVSPAWFLDMLQSLAWQDRKQAVWALELLTRDRDVFVLSRLRGDPLDALIEMAKWQTEAHAYPSFMLVGRVAGLTELAIRDAWLRAGRDTVIEQALKNTR